ncbi:MAG TPA: hypothetical protein PKE39_06095 [Ignavibacteria bacterium]|nr:hypothetical protein [Ignavibacteria bacterium]
MKKTSETARDSYGNSNIIELLKLFSKEEKADFAKYVHSPFNNRKEVARFFDELRRFFPLFEHKNFSRKYIFGKLYPGKSYKDDVIRRLSSNLFKLAEEYIAYKMFRENEFEQRKMILDFYSCKFDHKFFEIKARKTEAYLEKQPYRNADYFYRMKQVYTSKAFYFSQYDATRKKFDNTQERIRQTWQYTVIALLSMYDAAVNDMMYFNKKYNIKLLDKLLEIYNHPGFEKTTAAKAYYYSLKLNTDGRNDETFFALRNLLDENPGIFSKDELFGFYTGMHNSLFERGLIPSQQTSKLEFEVGVKMLDLGLITEGNTISAEWFANVFLKAIKANEIEYAEDFLSEYKMKLSEKERDNIVNYAYAELEMARNNHKKVLTYLSRIKFNNVWEKLRVNHMYMKVHYEMNNAELFYYITDSFRHLLKNETSVNKYVKDLHENFIKQSNALFRIKNGDRKISPLKIRKNIMSTPMAGNYWLLKKTDELKNT